MLNISNSSVYGKSKRLPNDFEWTLRPLNESDSISEYALFEVKLLSFALSSEALFSLLFCLSLNISCISGLLLKGWGWISKCMIQVFQNLCIELNVC